MAHDGIRKTDIVIYMYRVTRNAVVGPNSKISFLNVVIEFTMMIFLYCFII